MFRKHGSVPVLFDANKVDLVSIVPDGSTVNLYIVRQAGWAGSDVELESFQNKIQAYVSYAVDGQMHTDFPETTGLPWTIVLNSLGGPPDPRTAEIIGILQERLPAHGGTLAVRLEP